MRTKDSTTETQRTRRTGWLLWKDSAHAGCFRYSIDRQNVCPRPHVSLIALGGVVYRLERGAHRLLERFVDLIFGPEERVLILDPFVIADSHTAGVCENIRNQEYAFFEQHFVGARRRWSIRQLGDNLRFNATNIRQRD